MLNNFYNREIKFTFFKKFNIINIYKIEYLLLNQSQFLFLNNSNLEKKFYLLIPKQLFFFLKKNIFFFFLSASSSFNYKSFFFFFFNLKFYLKQLKNSFFKTIFIKGTNYKITLENNLYTLKLKLGYSHLIYLAIPNKIALKLFKKKLVLKSFSKTLLGNFCYILFNYRPINIFTGKGLLLKSRKKFKLKEYSKKI